MAEYTITEGEGVSVDLVVQIDTTAPNQPTGDVTVMLSTSAAGDTAEGLLCLIFLNLFYLSIY